MPKYSEPHERVSPGAGTNANSGLRKRFRDDELPAPILDRPIIIHVKGTAPLVQPVRTNAKKARPSKDQEPEFDFRQFLLKSSYLKMKALSEDVIAKPPFFESVQDPGPNHFKHGQDIGHMLSFYLTDSQYADQVPFMFNLGFQRASAFLKEMDLYRALDIYEGMAQSYLRAKYPIDHRKGLAAIDAAATIASAHVVAHALEYLNVDIGHMRLLQTERGLPWSSGSVISLGWTGSIDSLVPIKVIAAKCWEGCMEGYCADSYNNLHLRWALRQAFSSISDAERAAYGLPGRESLSDWQMSYLSSYILRSLGLEWFTSKLGYMQLFGACNSNIVQNLDAKDHIRAVNELGLDQPLNFRFIDFSQDCQGLRPSVALFEPLGMLTRNEGELRLTDLGKSFVKLLLGRMSSIQVNPHQLYLGSANPR